MTDLFGKNPLCIVWEHMSTWVRSKMTGRDGMEAALQASQEAQAAGWSLQEASDTRINTSCLTLLRLVRTH